MTREPVADPPVAQVIRHDFGGLAAIKASGPDAPHQRCRHMATVVDEVERTVGCATCGAPLDPIQVLLEYARKERHWRGWDAELNRTLERIAELKDEERKVKSRTASASRKDANAAVAHEQQATLVRRQAIAEKAKDIAELTRQIVQLARVESDVFVGGVRRKRQGGK